MSDYFFPLEAVILIKSPTVRYAEGRSVDIAQRLAADFLRGRADIRTLEDAPHNPNLAPLWKTIQVYFKELRFISMMNHRRGAHVQKIASLEPRAGESIGVFFCPPRCSKCVFRSIYVR